MIKTLGSREWELIDLPKTTFTAAAMAFVLAATLGARPIPAGTDKSVPGLLLTLACGKNTYTVGERVQLRTHSTMTETWP